MIGPIDTPRTARRGLCAVFAVTAAGGIAVAALATASPSATAATDPCAASEVAKTLGSVATTTGSYLDSHPETNTALTMISQQQAGRSHSGRSRPTSTPTRRQARTCSSCSSRWSTCPPGAGCR